MLSLKVSCMIFSTNVKRFLNTANSIKAHVSSQLFYHKKFPLIKKTFSDNINIMISPFKLHFRRPILIILNHLLSDILIINPAEMKNILKIF